MAVHILAVIIFLDLIASILAMYAEVHRRTAKVVTMNDFVLYCDYTSGESTVFGLCAFSLLFLSQLLVSGASLCQGFVDVASVCHMRFSNAFIASWFTFVGAEACLLGGSIVNSHKAENQGYKHQGVITHLSCPTIHEGVFAAAVVLILLSMMSSILYYWGADTGRWEKPQHEDLEIATFNPTPHQQQQQTNEYDKLEDDVALEEEQWENEVEYEEIQLERESSPQNTSDNHGQLEDDVALEEEQWENEVAHEEIQPERESNPQNTSDNHGQVRRSKRVSKKPLKLHNYISY